MRGRRRRLQRQRRRLRALLEQLEGPSPFREHRCHDRRRPPLAVGEYEIDGCALYDLGRRAPVRRRGARHVHGWAAMSRSLVPPMAALVAFSRALEGCVRAALGLGWSVRSSAPVLSAEDLR